MNANQMLQMLMDYKKYNKIDFYEPYPYQVKFANKSAQHKQRFLRAANRVGKSYGTAAEFAMHITGRYQDWFKGERITDSGHIFWCVGVDLSSVAKVMQKELLGTSDIRMSEKIGTGMIPKSHIVMEPMTKDAGSVRIMFVKHIDGGLNTLMFYGSNNESTLMGDTVKFIWMDEEPEHHSEEIYAQCKTRVMTTQGHLMLTATPEQGQTALNDLFDNDTTGKLYVQQATWWDAPHITENDIAEMSAGIPDWQLDMRSKGLPVLGTGAVFPIADESIVESPTHIPDYWDIVCAVDFGETTDASVIVFCARNPDDDTYHLVKEIYLDQSIEARTPRNMAKEILNSDWPHAIVVVPHDGGLNSDDPQAKGKLLLEYGCNVWTHTFTNPVDVKLGTDELKPAGRAAHNSIHAGLIEMRRRMEENTLKISDEMVNFFKEKRTYFWRENRTTGKRVPTGTDHCIDASRYALMSLIGGIYSDVLTAKKGKQHTWRDLQPKVRF